MKALPVGFVALLCLFCQYSCTGSPSPTPTSAEPGRSAASLGALGALPASYAGDLPCADCAGLRYTLNLFPDQAYFLSIQYLGKEEAPGVHDIGNWILSADQKVLTLAGGRDQILRFTVVDGQQLRMRGLDGQDIDSQVNYTLVRSPHFELLTPHTVMRGMYRYMADTGSFRECLTGRQWPVAQEGKNDELERAYAGERRQPNEELLGVLEGSIVTRPATEGNSPRPTLVVDRFIEFRPRETCGARFATDPLENTYLETHAPGLRPGCRRGAAAGTRSRSAS